MQKILLTIPAQAYEFHCMDTYEDLFLSYPSLQIKNDTVYFRDSNKVLLLLDGVQIKSIKEVPLPAIQKIEVLTENATTYGEFDAVVNIITKKFNDSLPYSNIKLSKNPDYIQFELARPALNLFQGNTDIYISGDLNEQAKWNTNIGYRYEFIELRTYYNANSDLLALQGRITQKFKYSLSKRFITASQCIKFKTHSLLVGTDFYPAQNDSFAVFAQDYWEPYPLLYIVPMFRLVGTTPSVRTKLSVGFIPIFNIILFASATQNQINIGVRAFESTIAANKNNDPPMGMGITAKIATPWIKNCKLTTCIDLTEQNEIYTLRSHLIIAEYRQEFKKGKLGLYIIGDTRTQNLRLELRILDAKIAYRINPSSPSYSLSWQFTD